MQNTDDLLHRMFERQAALTPDKIAVICGQEATSYRTLDEAANALANRLVDLGLVRQTIGISASRSLEQIVAVLAVLKVGGAYLPLDPKYPVARLEYFAQDAGVSHVIVVKGADQRHPTGITPVEIALRELHDGPAVSAPPAIEALPDDACFVIHTSGSTGQPKGVRSPHRATVAMMRWLNRDHPFDENERFCHRTTLNFIVSTWEIFGPLVSGSSLVIAPPGISGDAFALVRHLGEAEATRIVVVPTLLRTMVSAMAETRQSLPKLRHWFSVGEAFPMELARQWRAVAPNSLLHNLYGCSETHSAACFTLRQDLPQASMLPIGVDLPFRKIHIVGTDGRALPNGSEGEICISGEGLSHCYINKPELSAERFLSLPHLDDGPIYRTGDRALRMEDGNLVMLGRADRQVKIRGHRVELQEIEATLFKHPDVLNCAVVVRQIANEDELAAYVVLAGSNPVSRAALREYIGSYLPAAMIPAAVIFLETLPTTPNGKLDSLALPDPERARVLATPCIAPRNDCERALSDIWSRTLAIEPIGRDDDFFELGGFSNKAATVIVEIRHRFGVEIELEQFFELKTVACLASAISAALAEAAPALGYGENDMIEGFID